MYRGWLCRPAQRASQCRTTSRVLRKCGLPMSAMDRIFISGLNSRQVVASTSKDKRTRLRGSPKHQKDTSGTSQQPQCIQYILLKTAREVLRLPFINDDTVSRPRSVCVVRSDNLLLNNHSKEMLHFPRAGIALEQGLFVADDSLPLWPLSALRYLLPSSSPVRNFAARQPYRYDSSIDLVQ